MKLLKLLMSLLGICLLSIGILLYILHDASQSIVSGEIVNQISEQMNEPMLSSLESVGVSGEILEKAEQYLPQSIKEGLKKHTDDDISAKIDDVKEQLLESEELKQLTTTYSAAVLDGVIDGNRAMPDVDEDLKQLAKTYVPKLSTVIHIPLSEKQAEQISTHVVVKLNLRAQLNELTGKLHNRLSKNQLLALKAIRLIQKEAIQWVALGFMVFGIFLTAIGSQSTIKWTGCVGIAAIVCAAILWFGCEFLSNMLTAKLEGYSELLVSFSDGLFTAVQEKAASLCILGFGCFGSYGIITKLKQYQKH